MVEQAMPGYTTNGGHATVETPKPANGFTHGDGGHLLSSRAPGQAGYDEESQDDTEIPQTACTDTVPPASQATFKGRLRENIWRTLSNGFAMVVLGVMISMKGPTFIDIQSISDTDVEGGSFFVTASAFGYMTGSIIAGGLYDRVSAKYLLIFFGLILSAGFFAVVPMCADFVLMLLASAMVSVFCALFETTVNVEEVNSWEGASGSAMQFLSFCYSLGGILGPLIAEPFLAPIQNTTPLVITENGSGPTYAYDVISASTNSVLPTSALPVVWLNGTLAATFATVDPLLSATSHEPPNASIHTNVTAINNHSNTNQSAILPPEPESRVLYAYIISACMTVSSSIPFLALFCLNRKTRKRNKKPVEPNTKSSGSLPLGMYILTTGLISALYFFYTSVDETFAQYLSVFVVTRLSWTKEEGAEVSALYWSCSCVAKLVIVLMAYRFRMSILLLLSTLGMIVSMAMFTIFSHHCIDSMIWVSTACLALTQSSVFGGGIAWADAELIKFDGKVTSSMMIFASLGAMTTPLLLGYMMKELSPMAFAYVLGAQSVITFGLFVVLLIIIKPIIWRNYGPPRPSIFSSVPTESDQDPPYTIPRDITVETSLTPDLELNGGERTHS